MPLVEAMNCHVPSITSNVSSMPEVAASTGILVDPSNTEAIAEAMHTLVSDEKLYQELRQQCVIRKRDFSWEQTAYDVYQSMLKLCTRDGN